MKMKNFYPSILNNESNTIYTKYDSNIDQVSLYNINGQKLFTSNEVNRSLTFDYLSSGLYILSVEHNGITQHQKIIVQ